MIDNECRHSAYPLIPSHEVAGTVGTVGAQVKGLRIGLGWNSANCTACHQCLSSDHNLFRAFFERGEDIGAVNILAKHVAAVGLDETELNRALAAGTHRKEVSTTSNSRKSGDAGLAWSSAVRKTISLSC